ncbi:hypothetical protein ACIQAC_35105 [Streptomyces sp. NPDC088387]|uniref:hypothetical protein n=1 Tax=Streptomyces sp. NPDC088387 TaxID=3365859 RepID=UPI00382DC598
MSDTPRPPDHEVRLSVVVMSHPRRLDTARRLAARLGPSTRVVLDPEPLGPPSALRTALLAWRQCPDATTHHAVLQDDVLPVADAPHRMRQAAAEHPDTVLTFYANSISWNGAAARAAVLSGHTWLPPVRGEYFPTLAVVMPCALAHAFADYAERHEQSDDDEVLAQFLDKTRAPALLRGPSLVEHLDLPSLSGYDDDPIGHPDQYQSVRRSVCFPQQKSPPLSPAPLRELAAWPHFSQRRALLRLPSRLGRDRWQTQTRTAQLRLLGLRPDEHHALAEAAYEELEALPEPGRTARRFLRETALASIALGAVASRAAPDSAGPVRNALTDTAVSSLLDAGFGKKADVTRWQGSWEVLMDLAWKGIALGRARGIEAPPRPWT